MNRNILLRIKINNKGIGNKDSKINNDLSIKLKKFVENKSHKIQLERRFVSKFQHIQESDFEHYKEWLKNNG